MGKVCEFTLAQAYMDLAHLLLAKSVSLSEPDRSVCLAKATEYKVIAEAMRGKP